MNQSMGEFVERVSDHGQWFDRGVRVEYFRATPGPRERNLEKAVLGSYEVLACTRVEAEGGRWLDVRLRRLPHA